MDSYDEVAARLEDELRPKLTADFLDTLVQAGRTCAWNVDYIEVVQFIEWAFAIAGKPCPDTEPFQNP